MIKKVTVIVLAAALAVMMGGCLSLMERFGIGESEPEEIINGTNTGNILNYGFGVLDGDDIVAVYTGGSAYPLGSIVRSNPNTGENSLVLKDGGLYISLVDGVLYYCKPDGIYQAALSDPNPKKIVDGKAELLQINGETMYYIMDGAVCSADLDGAQVDMGIIKDAASLNVYNGSLYYIDTNDGMVYTANMYGGEVKQILDEQTDMFYIIDEVIYFISADSGYLKCAMADPDQRDMIKVVVEARVGGFNVNCDGLYYTREIEGKSVCCNADYDGEQENAIEDLGESAWHLACMWNDEAIITPIEDVEDLM